MAKNSYPLSYVSNSLNKIISSFVTEYSEELQSKAAAVTEKVAKDFAEQLKSATPRSEDPGGYEHLADTVIVSEGKERFAGSRGKILYVHYKKWQIAHLLEFGWTARNGKRVNRKPFIRPLFNRNYEKYYKMYKEELSK